MSTPTLSYTQSDVLKVSTSFKFDRYVAGRALSLNTAIGNDNNKQETNNTQTSSGELLVPRSAGSQPSGGVGLFPAGQTLYESLYGPQ